MAKPQLEDGYTPIANEILEKLARMPLAPNQWRVLLCVIRKTYGFHKKVDYIANFQIGEATGLCKAVVSRCLKGLDEMQLITRRGKILGFQKDWEKWQGLTFQIDLEPKEVPKKRIVRTDGYIGIWHGAVEPEFQSMNTKQGYIFEHRLVMARKLGRCLEPWEVVHHKDGVPSNNSVDNLELLPSQTEHLPSMLAQKRIKQLEAELAELKTKVDDKLADSPSTVAISSSTVAKRSTKVSSCAVTQKIKETITKDTLQKKASLSQKFEVFWKAYPKKKSKGDAEKAFAKVKPDEQLFETILATIETAKKSAEWLKDGGQFIPYPATWLNRKCWEDEFIEGGRDGTHRGRTEARRLPTIYRSPDEIFGDKGA